MTVADVDALLYLPGHRARGCSGRSGFPPSAPAGRARFELC